MRHLLDYANLDLENFDEWRRHKVPHLSGYIEEIAHNFVSASHAQFGWEMIGWSLAVGTTQRVAPNPIFARNLQQTRKAQADTFARYRAGNFTFPPDLEPNLCDRIHAHLLNLCETRYGPRFWPDLFAELRKQQQPLADAVHEKGGDAIRNRRYQITVDCFDRLPRLNFRTLLEANHISTTVDVKSLHPTDPAWNRKFHPPNTP